jgi:hypothetical protein
MGARTVAGEIVTVPIWTDFGTDVSGHITRPTPAPFPELSQNFFTAGIVTSAFKQKPPLRRGLNPCKSALMRGEELLLGRFRLGVLAAEALDTASGVHQLLLAREERMAIRANFYADVALMSRTGCKGVAAGAMHTNFVIRRMNSSFHVEPNLDSNHLILPDFHRIQQTAKSL